MGDDGRAIGQSPRAAWPAGAGGGLDGGGTQMTTHTTRTFPRRTRTMTAAALAAVFTAGPPRRRPGRDRARRLLCRVEPERLQPGGLRGHRAQGRGARWRRDRDIRRRVQRRLAVQPDRGRDGITALRRIRCPSQRHGGHRASRPGGDRGGSEGGDHPVSHRSRPHHPGSAGAGAHRDGGEPSGGGCEAAGGGGRGLLRGAGPVQRHRHHRAEDLPVRQSSPHHLPRDPGAARQHPGEVDCRGELQPRPVADRDAGRLAGESRSRRRAVKRRPAPGGGRDRARGRPGSTSRRST